MTAVPFPKNRLLVAQRLSSSLRLVGSSCVLCLPAFGMAVAQAQETSLPEVVVTDQRSEPNALKLPSTSASKLDIPIQDLPASVSSVSAVQIQERADYEVVDAVGRSVGLSVNSTPGNGGLSFSSRGFTGVNSVGVAEDGLSLGVAAGTVAYPNSSWGYERFDVLRGPASLMYGSGTMGATVNAVRKEPSRTQSSEVMFGAASNGTARAGLGTTGALSDSLSYRLDVYGDRTDGERQLGNSDSKKIMSAIRWQASSDLRLDLTADISDQRPERYFGTPVVDGKPVAALRDRNFNFLDSDVHYKDQRYKLKAEWNVTDALVLRNETYHMKADRHWKNIEGYDYNASAGLVHRYDYLEIGHDLEQSGNRLGAVFKPGQHEIAMGWDVSQAKFTALNSSPYTGESDVPLVGGTNGYWNSPDPYKPRMTSRIRQNAFYLEDAWKLDEQWLLLAGVRRDLYDFDRMDLLSQARFDKTLGGTSWRLGLTHKLDQNTSVYAQVSTGHDPVNSLLSLTQSQTGFSLSKGRQVEVGIKQQLPNDQGEWTLAVFDIRKKDIITRDPDRPSVSIQGGKQSSKGIELAGSWRATKAWRFEGNLAYVDAQFDELLEGATAIDRSGNQPANVPRYTANAWAHYQTGDWRASLGLRHVASRYTSNANTAQLPAYTVADAVLGWNLNRSTTLNLVGRNLANKRYAASSYGSQWLMGNGRSFELMAHLRF